MLFRSAGTKWIPFASALRPASLRAMAFPPRVFICAMQLAACIAATTGCATFKKMNVLPHRKPKPAVARAVVPVRVGTITLVNEGAHFVLIDTGMAAAPAVGTALKSFTGESASGVLAVGNVNRRPFVVADIVQGAPMKGDAVFQ